MISFRLLRVVIAATTLLEASILDGAEAIRFLSKSDGEPCLLFSAGKDK